MLSPIASYLGPKNHNPSIARKISREIKRGSPPESLLNLARTVNDSYYRSLSFVSIASSIKGKKSKELFEEAISNLTRVKQAWRRVELIGEITKILKHISDDVKKNIMFERTLTLLKNEKGENAKEFFVKYSKNYPDEMLESLLNKSLSGLYPPGSTIKPIVALSALENDVVSTKHIVQCKGSIELYGQKYHAKMGRGHKISF